MNTGNPCRIRGINSDILKVLTSDWQTSSLIACQIVIPPDLIQRKTKNQKIWNSKNQSTRGSKSNIVGQVMHSLVRSGVVEKRYLHGAKCEYRLAQPKD